MKPHLPSGYSAADISGLVGLTCINLLNDAGPDDWFVSTIDPLDELQNHYFFFFLLANTTNRSAALTFPMVSGGRLYDHIFVL